MKKSNFLKSVHLSAFLITGLSGFVNAEPVESSVVAFATTAESFPLDGVMPYGWYQPSDAKSGWKVTDSKAYEGTHSLMSTKTGDAETAAVAYRANFKSGNVSFYMRVSSEKGYDFAKFYIDDVAQVLPGGSTKKPGLTGRVEWTHATFPVAEGKHTLKWTYEKDESYADGSDGVWLDGVGLPETTQEISVSKSNGTSLVHGQSTISFDDLAVESTSATKILTIKNVGGAALIGMKVGLAGANPGDFTVQSLQTTVLDPGKTTTFKIAFAPNHIGPLSAVVRIVSNDANEDPFEINVKGTGLGLPKIGVFQADGSKLKDGAAIGFGSATVKSDGSTKTITIKNQGSAKLSGLKVSKSGGDYADFVISPLGRTSLGPGATTTFKVTFHPTALDKRKAEFQILSNDSKKGPFDLIFTGKGAPKNTASRTSAKALAATLGSLTTGTASQLPQATTVEVVQGQKYLALTVTKQAGVTGTVEVSPNLLDWFSGSKHTTILIDDATTLKVRDNTPVAPDVKRYIRLR